jgi:hypothetical protein
LPGRKTREEARDVEPWSGGGGERRQQLCLWPAIGSVAETGGREREHRPAAKPRTARRRRRRRRGVEASRASPSSGGHGAAPSVSLPLCSLSLSRYCQWRRCGEAMGIDRFHRKPRGGANFWNSLQTRRFNTNQWFAGFFQNRPVHPVFAGSLAWAVLCA